MVMVSVEKEIKKINKALNLIFWMFVFLTIDIIILALVLWKVQHQ
jgi:hypothetical protein|tara:strand:- start:821 stop:955 length:135 start_codon:yes stop_codon:yes gene_type:complete